MVLSQQVLVEHGVVLVIGPLPGHDGGGQRGQGHVQLLVGQGQGLAVLLGLADLHQVPGKVLGNLGLGEGEALIDCLGGRAR